LKTEHEVNSQKELQQLIPFKKDIHYPWNIAILFIIKVHTFP